MAKVIRQNIPPSLIGGFGSVLSRSSGTGNNSGVCGLNFTARAAKGESSSNPLLKLRRDAATWLKVKWTPAYPSSFYADRLEEIRLYDFDDKYWYKVLPTRDRTEVGSPAILGYEMPVNGQYDDPLRQQTDCVFKLWSKYYATPSGDGTVNEPAPGWEGTVIDCKWRDLWFAQRRLTFFLPVLVNELDGRQVLFDVQSQVTAKASFRVNRAWYARCLWPYFFKETSGEMPATNYLITKWNKTDIYPMDLVSEYEDKWQCTNNLRMLRCAVIKNGFHGYVNCNRLGVVITTPPSRGVYFARNDDVSVRHHETVTVYVGKSPNG